MNRITIFFYGLCLTTFSMGVYNTIREILEESNNLKQDVELLLLEQKLINSVEIKRELQTKYSEKNEDPAIIEQLQEVLNNEEEIQNMSDTLLSNNSGNKSQYLDSLQSFFDALNYEQILAVVHISGSLFILFSLINISSKYVWVFCCINIFLLY